MKEIKLHSKKWFKFMMIIALLTLLSIFVINYALARTVTHSNEIQTPIEGTNLVLFGEKQATSPDDYEIIEETNKVIIKINTPGWALEGEQKNITVRLNSKDLELRYVDIAELQVPPTIDDDINFVVKENCTANIGLIYVGNYLFNSRKFNETNQKLTISGTGELNFTFIDSDKENLDISIDGPSLNLVPDETFSNPRSDAVELYGNLDLIKGKIILNLESGSSGYNNGVLINGSYNIHIYDNFEYFCNLEIPISIETDDKHFIPTDYWSEGSMKSSFIYYTYENRNKITDIPEFLYADGTWLIALNNKLPQCVYHPVKAPVIPKLASISIETLPTKTEYLVGEQFDKTGLTIAKTYDDASVESGYVPADNEITGFDSSTEGEKIITITCSDPETKNNVVSTTFTVVVKSSITPQPDPDDPIVPIENEIADNQEVLLLPSSETGDDLVLVALLSAVLTLSFLFTFRFKRNR